MNHHMSQHHLPITGDDALLFYTRLNGLKLVNRDDPKNDNLSLVAAEGIIEEHPEAIHLVALVGWHRFGHQVLAQCGRIQLQISEDGTVTHRHAKLPSGVQQLPAEQVPEDIKDQVTENLTEGLQEVRRELGF